MHHKFVRSALWLAALPLCAAQPSVVFEPKPRVIAGGRDPMLSVRASGALSLMKVENGDLWILTSFDGGDSFDPPVRVNDVAGQVSSHGESTPQLQVRSRGEFYCLWQTRRGDGSVLRFARSSGWGESFGKAIDVDPDSAASQSFFTMNVSPEGAVYVAWLDGRDRARARPGASALYIARSAGNGAPFAPPVRVSLDVCPCCRPSIAFADEAVYVAWRGVQENSVRDIFVASSRDRGATWSPGRRVAEDNWALNGCPHSGASMAALGKRLFISWYAVRERRPALYFAYSDDGAQTFSRRHELSGETVDPNHPFLLRTGDRISAVFQARPADSAESWGPIGVYYREIDEQGGMSPLVRIGNAGNSASYPTFAFEEPGRIYAAWTEPAGESRAIALARGRTSRAH